MGQQTDMKLAGTCVGCLHPNPILQHALMAAYYKNALMTLRQSFINLNRPREATYHRSGFRQASVGPPYPAAPPHLIEPLPKDSHMMEKRFSSSRPSSLPAVMYALIIVAAITVSCSAVVVVHGSSEVRDQDTSAAVAYPDGGRQGPGPPAPQAGLTRGPGTPACCA